MPSVQRLAAEFSVNCKTAETTLQALENEGLLVGQGPGRRRKIILPEELLKPPGLRVAILCYE
jgi:DNA-binding transcriptional regulator YhcF (GntR family)